MAGVAGEGSWLWGFFRDERDNRDNSEIRDHRDHRDAETTEKDDTRLRCCLFRLFRPCCLFHLSRLTPISDPPLTTP